MIFSGMPKIKATMLVYSLDGHIYFSNAGRALQFEDETGFLTAVCSKLDGKKDVTTIEKELASEYAEQIKYLPDALQALNDACLLEDATQQIPNGLTSYDIERWSRNTDFFGLYYQYHENKYQSQLKLKNIKVALLGLGGLGSHILYDLAALGVHHIKAVDFDRIEYSNLNRQILYSEKDVGVLKTEAAKERITEFLPSGNFEFINKKLQTQNDVEEIVKSVDIVICVADRPRKDILSWVNASCVKYGIPYINGGVDDRRAMFFAVIPGKTGCAECWKLQLTKENNLTTKLHAVDMRDGPQDFPGPAVVTFVSTLTGLMLTKFLKLVTGISQIQAINRLMVFDFDSLELKEGEVWNRQFDCKVCCSAGNEGN